MRVWLWFHQRLWLLSISTSSSIMSSSNTTTTYSYRSSNCSSTSMLLQFRVVEVLHSQKNGSDCAVGNLHNMLKLDWLINEWLIQIELQLEVICQISRHYKQCQCQIFMEYTWLCIQIFHNWMDHFERDVLDDEKLLRSCEEFDSLSENRLNQLDQQVLLRISFLIWEMHQSDWEKL